MTSPPSRAKKRLISNAQQWRAVNSPTRLRILALLEATHPLSIAELGEQLGLRPDSLYHHIRLMEKAGVVRETGFQKNGRHAEALYDLAADEFEFDIDTTTGHNLDQLDKLHKAVLRNAGRVLESALITEAGQIKGPKRNMYSRYETGWLTAAQVKEVAGHIEAISAIFRTSQKNRQGTLMMANCNFAPLQHRQEE